jgi:HD-like signal output (HDOD) protein
VQAGESLQELSSMLEKDPGISSKIISVSNSVQYKGMAPVKTLEQAIGRIGITEARNYVELIANRSLYASSGEKHKANLDRLWQHSLACAYACRELAKMFPGSDPTEMFAMGLFHDIGELLLIQIISELESKGAYENAVSDLDLRGFLDKHHGQFGAALMRKWKLAEEFQQAAQWHEDLANASAITPALLITNLGDQIVKSLGYGEQKPGDLPISESKAVSDLNIDDAAIEKIKESVSRLMEVGAVI